MHTQVRLHLPAFPRARRAISQHALGQIGDLPACPGQTVDLPARVFDDPPVVDVFKGITCDLLLVRAAPPILIPEHTNRK